MGVGLVMGQEKKRKYKRITHYPFKDDLFKMKTCVRLPSFSTTLFVGTDTKISNGAILARRWWWWWLLQYLRCQAKL